MVERAGEFGLSEKNLPKSASLELNAPFVFTWRAQERCFFVARTLMPHCGNCPCRSLEKIMPALSRLPDEEIQIESAYTVGGSWDCTE